MSITAEDLHCGRFEEVISVSVEVMASGIHVILEAAVAVQLEVTATLRTATV
jgi:hypothetical protein